MTRYDIINNLIRVYGFRSFLEIGTASGETFRNIDVPEKVSVDPDTNTAATYHMTSDEYFKRHRAKFDIIFIDGLHEAEQAYRDIQNALKHLNHGGAIVVHDVHPEDERMQQPYTNQHFWTGDVWKAFVKARRELPYQTFVYDYDFGCGVILTAFSKDEDLSDLPSDISKMTYQDFVNHPEWMNFVLTKEGVF